MVGTAAIALLVLGQAAARPPEVNPEVLRFKIENVEFGQAMRQLSKQTGVPITVRPELKGLVSLDVMRVPLSTTLYHLVIQVDGGFELRDGKFVVFGKGSYPSGKTLSHFQIETRSALIALIEVFRFLPGVKWQVDGTFKNEVKVRIDKEVPWEVALREVLEQARGDYQVSKGVYCVQVGPVTKVR